MICPILSRVVVLNTEPYIKTRQKVRLETVGCLGGKCAFWNEKIVTEKVQTDRYDENTRAYAIENKSVDRGYCSYCNRNQKTTLLRKERRGRR